MRTRLTPPAVLLTMALAGCDGSIMTTATNAGLAAATVASPTLAPVTAPVLAARLTAPAKPAATPAPPAAPAGPPPAAATTEAGLIGPVNRFRAAQNLPPLIQSAALNAAALAHAFDMTQNGFVSHTGADGSTVGTRASAAGCDWSAVAETIATGQTDAAGAVFSWIERPDHRRTLTYPFTHVGEARVGRIWVAVYAQDC